ncbi:hypothetical protein FH972_026142 [Carpinus fangiana]|uniref:Nephrocystin 3-like N-terminal domain-containing protein n=1 Tax=Carpinus fangiana TaxID=176857 RepID=A0A5N6L356_9ROSI|nr:hypothetical protein FH972_026142 [Carpinus fangiana]
MDPASVIGVIGVTGQIIKVIYQYGDAVSECKVEVAGLRAELFGLQAALTHIERDLESSTAATSHPLASPNLTSPECRDMLEEARTILGQLATTLEQTASRSKRLAKQLVWPLKRKHVQGITAHLERLKTYFILAATHDTLQATKGIAESIRNCQVSLEDLKTSEEQRQLQVDIIKWLGPCETENAHIAALSVRLEGTNSWFLDEIFPQWTSEGAPLLWLKGIPGSGKTCIIAACINRMIQTPADSAVAYFYCSHNNSASQQARNIIASLVGQLYQHEPATRNHAVQVYHETRHSTNISTLIFLIKRMCGELSKNFFVFIDAVNECAEEMEPILQALCQLASQSEKVKLMLSSTEGATQLIQEASFKFQLKLKKVDMDPVMVTSDINTYIDARLSQEPRLVKLRPQLQSQIKEELQRKHQGSFRWAQCTFDDLADMGTPKAIKVALKGVTSGLSDIYMAVLDAIPRNVTDIALSMLSCLLTASRQLTISELAEAAAFTWSDDFDEDDRLIEPELAIRHLRILVRYDTSTQLVELAHSSVRDFLTSPDLCGKFYIDPAIAIFNLSVLCVEYLTLPAFQHICSGETALEERKQEWPFFEYASHFWTRHARASANVAKENVAAISKFLDSAHLPGGGNFASWYQCVYPQGTPIIWSTHPLYMCAREGLIEPLKVILAACDRDELERRGGSRGSTALHVAASIGELEAVRLLLAAGANPNECNDYGESGIQYALVKGYDETVHALLEGGATPNLLRCKICHDISDRMAKLLLYASEQYALPSELKVSVGSAQTPSQRAYLLSAMKYSMPTGV